MFEKLKTAINNFATRKQIDKQEVEALIKEIQRALILSDVNVKVVFELTQKMKKRIFEEKKHEAVSLREHVIKVVYEELTNILGKEKGKIEIKPQKIMLVGLYGTGKTTTAGKLAYFFKKKGLKPFLLSVDVYRPAAYTQLKTLAEQIEVPYYGNEKEKDPVKILKEGLKAYEKSGADVLIVDTAGRDALTPDLIEELKKINEVLLPDETYLVIAADIGQGAKSLVEAFKSAVSLTGIIITKMDSSAKGGGALTAAYLAGTTVKFLGIGEKLEDLEYYDPVRFVSRLLGMGDLESLLEKVKEVVDEEKIKEMWQSDKYNIAMFYEQLQATQKMGSLQKMIEMIPGMSRLIPRKEELEEQEKKMRKWKYIIDSMTKEERENPSIINTSRIKRIAKGSGTSEEEVREMLKAYKMSEKMFKKFKSGKFMKDPKIRKMLANVPMQ
ncbi:MAG: signal recognition particle protein [Candidatus Nanohaloarchaeota archaeon]|nr:signal recognition particle protein [Candidatus Nanohaloarchaeota archaeon]